MLNTLLTAICVPECSYVAIPEATEQAMRYYHSGNILWILGQALALIIPLLFLIKGFTGKLAAFTKRSTKYWFLAVALYLVIFLAIYQLLSLPFDYYASFVREHEYGLSTQTLSRWFSNYGKGVLITMITAIIFVWIFYLVIKKSPRKWWFYSSLVTIGILFIMIFIQPLWIDPLFNDFGPMKNKELEHKILNLAERAGIENGRVFEVDKSQDTRTLNAYVIGCGSSHRIVLWDTTIQKMTPDEILFVMGHEMGHYVLHHIWWQVAYFSLLTFVIFYLTYKSATYLMKKYHRDFGFNHLYNIASFPLLIFLLALFSFLSLPLTNYVTRCMEEQADCFGIEITQNNQAAAEAFIVLQQDNLANPRPGPIYMFWRGSHPSLAERIEFINNYCPWRFNAPLRYQKYFDHEMN